MVVVLDFKECKKQNRIVYLDKKLMILYLRKQKKFNRYNTFLKVQSLQDNKNML